MNHEDQNAQAVVGREPCPDCGSSDNLIRRADGHAFCHTPGCGRYEPADTADAPASPRPERVADLYDGEVRALPARGIDRHTCEKFRYMTGHVAGQTVQIATYCDRAGRPVGQKIRTAAKEFFWVGSPKLAGLFGQQLWKPGGRRLIVTEGEIDALSVYQAPGHRWPVVSVPNGAGGAEKDCKKELEYLNSFEEVILVFDQDEAGRAAATRVALLLDPGKARIAQLPLKDANEMLVAHRSDELVQAIGEAAPYRPDEIIPGATLWEAVSAEPEMGLEYPWPRLSRYLHGMRRGELVMWCGGTGSGKSSLVRQLAHQVALVHGKRVGIIALEESVRQAALSQMSITAGRPLHLPEVRQQTSQSELRTWFDETFGSDRIFFYDHFGSVDAETILPKLRYLVKGCDCDWVILDHISIMVSGMATDGDERKRIDELMTKLRSLVENAKFGLHVVTHLRKSSGTPHEEGGRITLADLRGSGAIAQVSDLVIAAERNQQDDDPAERNLMKLRVLKNRFSGETGLAELLTWRGDQMRSAVCGDPSQPATTALEALREQSERDHKSGRDKLADDMANLGAEDF